jgi:hypothetical protein
VATNRSWQAKRIKIVRLSLNQGTLRHTKKIRNALYEILILYCV